jgi:hypothetical protein
MFKKEGTTIRLKFGKPLPYTIFDTRFTYDEWVRKIKAYTYLIEKSSKIPDFEPDKL